MLVKNSPTVQILIIAHFYIKKGAKNFQKIITDFHQYKPSSYQFSKGTDAKFKTIFGHISSLN